MQLLVAGFGNVLRGDDGFGVAVAQALLAEPPPPRVLVADVGIGGIHAVQLLFDRPGALIVVDAVDLGRPPGTVVVQRPDVSTPRPDEFADMHYATPQRALRLAQALGVLPGESLLVGCQVGDAQALATSLSPVVAAAVPLACEQVRRLARGWGISWPAAE